VRNTEEIFEFVNNIKKILNKNTLYIPIYLDTETENEDIKYPKKYKIFAERTDREIITNIKNSARPQSLNKRRKLIRS
jgi:hypothetical protein